MYSVSNAFKTAMESNIKGLTASIEYIDDDEDTVILTDCLSSIKISADGELGSSSMRRAEIVFLKYAVPSDFLDYISVGEYFKIKYGVMTVSPATYESIYIGAFKVVEIENKEDDETIKVVAYDRMYDTMVPYLDKKPADWTSITTLLQYITIVLANCGITLGNTVFVLNNLEIKQDRFLSIYGYKVRDLINDICKISGTVALISNDDKLYFRKLGETTITYSIPLTNFISYKEEQRYGDVNEVIFAREPQADYKPRSYADSIDDYGVTQWKVDNNQLIDYQPIIEPDKLLNPDSANPPTSPIDARETYIDATFVAVCGVAGSGHAGAIYYYPFEAETMGYGWFEIGDRLEITKDSRNILTTILGYSVTLDGGITETLSAPKTNKTDTKVKFTSNKFENQTQLVVDKQNQVIVGYVAKTTELGSVVSQFQQQSDKFTFRLYDDSGYNLLQNSVMYDWEYDDNYKVKPKIWTSTGVGTIEIYYVGKGISRSGNSFILNDKYVSQTAKLLPDPQKPVDARYCSFSFGVRKGFGKASYEITNGSTTELVELTEEILEDFTFFGTDKILPKSNQLTITLFGDANTNTTFTDVILCESEKGRLWSQFSGEVTNANVVINDEGIKVRGKGGLETVITDNSLVGRVKNDPSKPIFTVSSELTSVSNLKVNNGINMPPIKIVPIYGSGWAFVSSPDEGGI